jgi:hypothetical protein
MKDLPDKESNLFGSLPRARSTDPLTSHAAARKAARWIAPTHQEMILGVLWRPMIPPEIANLTALSVVQIDRRRHELVEQGLIRIDGVRDGFEVWHKVLPHERNR